MRHPEGISVDTSVTTSSQSRSLTSVQWGCDGSVELMHKYFYYLVYLQVLWCTNSTNKVRYDKVNANDWGTMSFSLSMFNESKWLIVQNISIHPSATKLQNCIFTKCEKTIF